MKSGVVFLIAGVVIAAAVLLAGRGRAETLAKVDASAVKRVLEDTSQAWYRNHSVPKPLNVSITYVSADKMGSFAEPPAMTPVMPVDVACYLTRGGGSAPAGHPLHGRDVRLVDMRIRSLHMLEHLPGSVNLTMSTLPGALKNGPAKDYKKNELIIVYGDLYPHFDAAHAFRAAGFDAVYCLQGGMKLWKERGYPVESRPDFAEFGKVLESEEPVAHPGDSSTVVDPENIGPMALNTAMELGLKPMIVFVGDEATYRSGHIPGAIRIAQPDILKRFESESEDRNRLIVLYCGCCEGIAKGLSGTALFQLKGIGYKRLLNLEGHLKGWKDAGLPLVKEDALTPDRRN